MKELEVVLDVRQSPDTPELIVVKQKVSAEGGELRLVGEPTEARVDLFARRVKVTVGELANGEIGYVMAAYVQNVGLAPVDISRVLFEWEVGPGEGLGTRQGPGGKELIRGIHFLPIDRAKRGPLLPGETRGWYLPMDFYEEAVRVIHSQSPDACRIGVYSGADLLGKVPGSQVLPFLDRPIRRGQVLIHRRAQTVLESLPEKESQNILNLLESLRSKEPNEWPGGGKRLSQEKPVYLVKVAPTLHAFVRRLRVDAIEVLDLVREDALRLFIESRAKAGA